MQGLEDLIQLLVMLVKSPGHLGFKFLQSFLKCGIGAGDAA